MNLDKTERKKKYRFTRYNNNKKKPSKNSKKKVLPVEFEIRFLVQSKFINRSLLIGNDVTQLQKPITVSSVHGSNVESPRKNSM
jgi:hypothetical protein